MKATRKNNGLDLRGRNKRPDGILLPEPLAIIWEPKVHQIVVDNLNCGIACPRKTLIASGDLKVLWPTSQQTSMNVDTLVDYSNAKILMVKELPHK